MVCCGLFTPNAGLRLQPKSTSASAMECGVSAESPSPIGNVPPVVKKESGLEKEAPFQ